MDESTRNDIIRMFYSQASHRRIAKTLAVDRKTVAKIIAEHEETRSGTPAQKRKPRKSLLDPFQDNIVQILERYPNITAVRFVGRTAPARIPRRLLDCPRSPAPVTPPSAKTGAPF